MRILQSLAAGLILAIGITAASHRAAAATYNLNGMFFDGALLTGSLDYDGSTFSNVHIVTTGPFGHTYTVIPRYEYSAGLDEWSLNFSDYRSDNERYVLGMYLEGALDDPGVKLYDGRESTSQQRRELSTLSITVASTVVTPIPAALPLAASALAGLGGLGILKRRRSLAAG